VVFCKDSKNSFRSHPQTGEGTKDDGEGYLEPTRGGGHGAKDGGPGDSNNQNGGGERTQGEGFDRLRRAPRDQGKGLHGAVEAQEEKAARGEKTLDALGDLC